jgi:transketolase
MSAAQATWRQLAQQLRIDSIRSTTAAGSGHPSSSMSAADLMAVLMCDYLHYDFDQPDNPHNDHLVLSKGHASPLLYAMYKAAGAISDEELLSLRRFGSPLEGHPVPGLPWVEVATGSLGQGLPIGVGMALAGKYLDKLPYRVWVLLGDSEMSEGSIWEGFEHASHYGLNNLVAILDVNRYGQRGETMLGWHTAGYAERAQSFGWETVEIDGHNLEEINAAFAEATDSREGPFLIIAKSVKGSGAASIADRPGWHGKALTQDEAAAAIKEIGGNGSVTVQVQKPAFSDAAPLAEAQAVRLPSYEVGSSVATRKAYGEALRSVGEARPDVVALDAEVSNSTYAEDFAKAVPDRFFEMYIAEQQMVAAAVGMQVRGWKPFASTFAAFLTRAYDFIRMAAISRANIRLCGSHAGVSIGEDGPSQMALEDIAMMRAVYGSTVLYPSDGNQTAHLVAQMADREGIVFLRTTRQATPVIYPAEQQHPIGGSVTLRSSERDQATIVAAGITVHEALKAHDALAREGISVRVIDAYSVKPIDEATLRASAAATGNRVVVAEDHWPEGGLGDAVLSAFANNSEVNGPLPSVVKLAVRAMPGSGKPAELLDAAGISADHIVSAVRSLLK